MNADAYKAQDELSSGGAESFDNYSTEVTEENLKNALADEHDVKYSADGKRLLSSYRIHGIS